MTENSNALPTPDTLPSYLSNRQVAYLLDCTPDAIRRLVRKKILRAYRIGGSFYVRTEDVRVLLNARRRIQKAA